MKKTKIIKNESPIMKDIIRRDFMFQANKKKIVIASQDKCNKIESKVNKLLKLLGHKDALVTDESIIGDFLDIFDKKRREKQLKTFSKKIGFKVKPRDFIYKVAEKL